MFNPPRSKKWNREISVPSLPKEPLLNRFGKEVEDRRALESAREIIRDIERGSCVSDDLLMVLERGREWIKIWKQARSLYHLRKDIALRYRETYGEINSYWPHGPYPSRDKSWHLMFPQVASQKFGDTTLCGDQVYSNLSRYRYRRQSSPDDLLCIHCYSSPFFEQVPEKEWMPEEIFLKRVWNRHIGFYTNPRSKTLGKQPLHLGVSGCCVNGERHDGMVYGMPPLCPNCEENLTFEFLELHWQGNNKDPKEFEDE